MADGPPSPPRVEMFSKSSTQAFHNSSFAAVGRDQVNVNVAVTTGGQPPSFPIQGPQSRPRDPSLVSRFLRRFRQSRRQLDHEQSPQPVEVIPPSPSSSTQPAGSNLLPTSLSDVTALSDGSTLALIDRPFQVPQPRPCASSEEEVYERGLLPKGHGHPMYNPSPLPVGSVIKVGDYGIITQDGFQSFGNLYASSNLPMDAPQGYDVICKPEKFKEGQTFVMGMEDARRSTNGINDTGTFEFHCREQQGAVLVITSSATLKMLSPLSNNELRRYLCDHGTQLMLHLCNQRYLNPGQSLYVVTGTIQSDSWGIAVHTSPMREPYDFVVLSRKDEKGGDHLSSAYEWARKGKADARFEASTSVDDDGRRTKDQSLFLRGFLITPSPKFGHQTNQGKDEDSHSSHPSSGPDFFDSEGRREGEPSNEGTRKHVGSGGSNGFLPTASGSHQLKYLPDPHSVVPFPSVPSKDYYPSQRINDMLLRDLEADMAITHDDDWRHIIKDGFLDDDCLDRLSSYLDSTASVRLCNGVAAIVPPIVRGSEEPKTWQTSTFQVCDGKNLQPDAEKSAIAVEEEVRLESGHVEALAQPGEKDDSTWPKPTGKKKALLIGIETHPDRARDETREPSTPNMVLLEHGRRSMAFYPGNPLPSKEETDKEKKKRNGGNKKKEDENVKQEYMKDAATSSLQDHSFGSCHRDVEEMAKMLVDLYNYPPSSVTTMVDSPAHIATSSHLLPTRKNIIRQIDELVREAVEGDRFFFLFIGHSTPLFDGDGKGGAITTFNNTIIRDEELRQLLVRPLPPGAKLTAVFDRCGSPGLLDLGHFRCNRIWLPWVTKSKTRGLNRMNMVVRKAAAAAKPTRPLFSPLPGFAPSARSAPYFELKDAPASGKALLLEDALPSPWGQQKKDSYFMDTTSEDEASDDSEEGDRDRLPSEGTPGSVPGWFIGERNASSLVEVAAATGSSASSVRAASVAIEKGEAGTKAKARKKPRLTPRVWADPEATFCSGWCRVRCEQEGVDGKKVMPFIVSLSAAGPGERSWDDALGASMTQHLVMTLRKDPSPTLGSLLGTISHELHASQLDMHLVTQVREMKKRTSFKGKYMKAVRAVGPGSFQDPQLSSLWPLDVKNEVWDP